MDQIGTATDSFIHAENIILFRKRLTETIDAAQRLQLLRLLSEEEAKRQLPPKEKLVASVSSEPSTNNARFHFGGLTVRG